MKKGRGLCLFKNGSSDTENENEIIIMKSPHRAVSSSNIHFTGKYDKNDKNEKDEKNEGNFSLDSLIRKKSEDNNSFRRRR